MSSSTAEAIERIGVSSQSRLIWRRFRRHRLAVVSAVFVILIYLVAVFAEVVAPTTPDAYKPQFSMAPPQQLGLLSHDAGGWHFGLHVSGYNSTRDPKTLRRVFVTDPTQPIQVGWFVRGTPYLMWGVLPMDLHLIGPAQPGQPFYLLGADRLGRDVLSRATYGARVSLSIGLVGVVISLVLGVLLGGISGYFGGTSTTSSSASSNSSCRCRRSRSGWALPRRSR